MRVVIVGGGIGGVGLAIALHKAGMEPIVLEQARAMTAVGAGVQFTANGMRVLTYLGCDQYVRKTGVRAGETAFHDLQNGRRLFAIQLGGAAAEEYGDYTYHLHRADLLDALLSVLPADCLRLGSKVIDIEETADEVRVSLDSGEQVRGDLAVGADGIKSMVRERLFGKQEARFTNKVAWRAVFPVSAELPIEVNNNAYLGVGRAAIYYSVSGGTLHNFVGFCPADETHPETWTTAADPIEVQRAFAGACEKVRQICAAITMPFITPIYFRDPLASWGTQRITLLGDAAHPAQPTWGNGAQMALEDGVTLLYCLKRHGKQHIAEALQEYQARRHARASRGQLVARMNARFMWDESEPAQIRARNRRFLGYQQIDPIGKTMFGWLYDFDAIKAAELPLDAQPQNAGLVANPLRRLDARRAFEMWRGAVGREDHAAGWLGQRAGYERFLLNAFPADEALVAAAVDCNGVCALSVSNRRDDGPIIMHLHGGAWVMGSARSAVELSGRLADAVQGRAYAIDYRLAPEHGFPAALDDAKRAFRALADRHGANNIIVTGECAGGGLAVSLALALRDAGEPLPAALYVVSPFCDLSLTARSIDSAQDPLFDRRFLTELACAYIQDTDYATPLVSPMRADLTGLPRLLIHAAADEALRDDADALIAAAQRAGIPVASRIFEDTVHSFVLFNFLPETERALDEFARFAIGSV